MKNHWLWMIIGCGLPLLLIFLLPVFGIKSNTGFLLFMILCFASHLFMMRDMNHTSNDKHSHH
jgi:cell division protein FtsW (lipid II flippase)